MVRNNRDNPGANISKQKYQKEVQLRRNKVKDLLIRGYSQFEIASILHISQPNMISRDITANTTIRKKDSKCTVMT